MGPAKEAGPVSPRFRRGELKKYRKNCANYITVMSVAKRVPRKYTTKHNDYNSLNHKKHPKKPVFL